MSKLAVIREFVAYTRHHRKYWLLPILIVLLAIAVLLVAVNGSALAPFLYSLF